MLKILEIPQLISMVPQEFKVPFFDNSLGFLITFIAIVIGGYFFVYLPKQTEIKHKRMGDYGNENTAQGLKNAAVGQGVEKVGNLPSIVMACSVLTTCFYVDHQTASIMSPPSSSLAPPKDDPISLSELAKYNGSNPSLPIYLAIKGTVFDVTAKKEMYGPGGSYNIFAGKDGSVGLGKISNSIYVLDSVRTDWFRSQGNPP
jgi:predicted heme/steroid binding protein